MIYLFAAFCEPLIPLHSYNQSIPVPAVCDFGNVTLGNQRKRVIKLINEGTIPVSFELNKALMAKSPFAVEPNKVVRLPPNTPVE